MRLAQHLYNDNILTDFITLATIDENVVMDTVFTDLQKLGDKVGLKVKKTSSFGSYLSSSGKNFVSLLHLISRYVVANSDQRGIIKNEIHQVLGKIDKRDLMAFLIKLDTVSLGLTAIVRHVLMSVFGIEITTYDAWVTNIKYIMTGLDKIKEVMTKINATEEEWATFNAFYDVMVRTKEEIDSKRLHEDGEVGGGEGVMDVAGLQGATTTGHVAKMWNKIGSNPARRRKKKSLKHLFKREDE